MSCTRRLSAAENYKQIRASDFSGAFIYFPANKGTDLDIVVQEIADFCDDRDETRFGEDYYVLDMR